MDVFSNLLRSNYGTLFGEQQGVLSGLNASLTPLVSAGPSQRGFSGAQTNALNTAAINASGGAAKQAEQAARTFGAGEGGGGTSGLTSGIQKQIESSIASSQAANLGNEENKITMADFNQGNANYWRAVGGQQVLAGEMNPNAAASSGIGAGEASFQEASKINQENNAMGQDIAGLVTAGIGAAANIALPGSGSLFSMFKGGGGGAPGPASGQDASSGGPGELSA
jgi:hypothetical protein